MSGANFVWPFDALPRHAVILGASGMGKTETSMRIAHEVALKTDAPLFYLDAKGDRETAERFVGLMSDTGRRARVFPNERFDAWRGDWRGIVNRLLEVIDFVSEGPAAYYRDIAKTALQLACDQPDGPPRSSAELLQRLDYELLMRVHGPTGALLSLPRDKVDQVRMRYQAFFGQLGSALDGEWSWEDVDAAYLLLDSVALAEDAFCTARLFFADFAHYFTQRKPPERLCVFFVDEFAALARSSDMAVKVEQARSFNVSLVMAPQTLSGMGSREQRDRILGSVETVISHAVNEPDELVGLAGMKRMVELTHRYANGVRGREGHARLVERPKVDPDQVRRQPPGSAWVIRRGRAARVQIAQAPFVTGRLPIAESIAPLTMPIPQSPKQIGYLDEQLGSVADTSPVETVESEVQPNQRIDLDIGDVVSPSPPSREKKLLLFFTAHRGETWKLKDIYEQLVDDGVLRNSANELTGIQVIASELFREGRLERPKFAHYRLPTDEGAESD